MAENTTLGSSEIWQTKTWSELGDSKPRTHVMFKFKKKSTLKLRSGGVLLFVPIKLAPVWAALSKAFDTNSQNV